MSDDAVFIVGCWPASAQLVEGEVVPAVNGSRAVAKELGLSTQVALSFDANGRWIEAALMTIAPDADARKLARRLGQRYLLGWYPDRIEVIDARRPSDRVTTAWTLVPVNPPICPMLLGPEPGTECVDPGGPWVGASIHKSAFWNAQRRLATGLLGCSGCTVPSCLAGPDGSERGSEFRIAGPHHAAGFFPGQRITIPTRTRGWESDSPDEWVPVFADLSPAKPK